jgi:hypothetical protein
VIGMTTDTTAAAAPGAAEELAGRIFSTLPPYLPIIEGYGDVARHTPDRRRCPGDTWPALSGWTCKERPTATRTGPLPDRSPAPAESVRSKPASPCSSGEQRILQLSASLAAGIPADIRDAITGLGDGNIARLVTSILHASGKRPENSR